jgi:glycosyltransferase involved in cell wall biosynthesis
MKILHYSLGLPPYRSGGLTKYSVDLMLGQLRQNDEVILLYPGHYSIPSKPAIIVNVDYHGIKVYELVNPLPVPLISGIGNPRQFYKKVDATVYIDFLDSIRPDIIHVHSFMGLHKEFFEAARKLNIRTVYTTHDCFVLCPKSLIDYRGQICNDYLNGEKCVTCNRDSHHLLTIYILQSRLYRKYKSMLLKSNAIKWLAGRRFSSKNRPIEATLLGSDGGNQQATDHIHKVTDTSQEYVKLRNYCLDILGLVDVIHFNSSVIKNQYERYLTHKGKVISITHSDIKDERVKKDFGRNDRPLRILYIGPVYANKGFFLLADSLNKLKEMGLDQWQVILYSQHPVHDLNLDKKHFIFMGEYKYGQLKKIFGEADLLIMPTITVDSFGFTGLEALSHGVPVIVSTNAGFKDVVENNKAGIVVEPRAGEISRVLEEILRDRRILENIHGNILKMDFSFGMDCHVREISNLYQRALSGHINDPVLTVA